MSNHQRIANLFANNDYVCYDFIRLNIWNNANIEFWYRQNILVFAHKSVNFGAISPVSSPNFLLAPEMYCRHFMQNQ